MMENHDVSIDNVRALVAERQRYDDWLDGLEARRDETPQRVFDRVQADYQSRRDGVLAQLRDHVESLKTMRRDFLLRLDELDSKLATLQDERAEAMLRTAVGEFDDDRWEKVRTDVEAQLDDFGKQRDALQEEITDVSELLASADTPVAVDAIEETVEIADTATDSDESVEAIAVSVDAGDDANDAEDNGNSEPSPEREPSHSHSGMMSVSVEVTGTSPLDISDDMLLDDVTSIATGVDSGIAASAESAAKDRDNADIEDALALFSNDNDDDDSASKSSTLDGVDVFADAGLTERPTTTRDGSSRDGSSRDGSSRDAAATATVTPQSSPITTTDSKPSADAANDTFDDLAFLRSVVDPSSQSGSAKAAGKGDQQKTLRCTECSTMNLPTEWYCERCGGELAAF